ncbi:MAG TPA: hypothetical protein VHA07_07240, partial [Devosia sp.]|nr:hypothetical protein [Devosia sp.]
GDDIFAGRAVALAAELAVSLNVALAARALRTGWTVAMLTALTFLAFCVIYYNDAVAIDDPQWLGQAAQSCALVLLLRRQAGMRTLALAALFCLLGGLAKQSLVCLPLAITLWLAFEDRRLLLRWLIASALLLALSLGALVAVYGRGFIDQVLLSERGLWSAALLFVGRTLAVRIAPYAIFAAAGIWLDRQSRGTRLLGIYLAVSLVVGIALLAVDGVGYSVLFDATIAMMVGTGRLIQTLADRLANTPAARAGLALVLVLPLTLAGPGVQNLHADIARGLAQRGAWQQAIDRLAAAQGPVACEMLSLCYWAGRASAIEFFNFGQYARLHPGFAASAIARIGRGELAMIQEDGPSGSRRLPPAVNAAVSAAYAVAMSEPTTLLVPAAP